MWRYLYRAIDRSGALVDVMFSEHRDMAAAKAFFESAKMATGITPDRVTTDGHDNYPRAIRTVLGTGVRDHAMAEMVFVDAILASAILSAAPPRHASPCLEPTVRFQRILAWNGPVENHLYPERFVRSDRCRPRPHSNVGFWVPDCRSRRETRGDVRAPAPCRRSIQHALGPMRAWR